MKRVCLLLLFALRGAAQTPPPYQLGAGDQISIRILEVEEIHEKPVRVDEAGDVNLAIVGKVRAAGLTVPQFEEALNTRLKKYVIQPAAAVTILEMKSQPVAVAGAVKNPGIVQLQGNRTLLEVISMAGGLSSDAGYRLQITRPKASGPLPIAGATSDPTGQYLIGEVSWRSLLEGRNPADNILMAAHDVVTVPRAEVVYVIGEVKKPGGFALADNEKVSVLQALAMAEGTLSTAAPQKAAIKRLRAQGEQRVDIPVDLRKVLDSKNPDVALQPNDILFIPSSASRRASTRALEMLLQVGTGVAIYRR